MDLKGLDWTDYVVIFIAVVVILGLFVKFAVKKTNTLDEYIWGGSDLGVWSIAGSLIATNVSGLTFFASTEIYQFGVNIIFENIGILFLIVVIRLQSQVLCKLKLPSLNEYAKLRYNRNVQILSSLMSLITLLWATTLTAFSAAVFFTQINKVPLMINVIVILAASYLLSALSGFKGVVWTDAVQTVAILFTLTTLIVYGLIRVGHPMDIIPLAWEGGRFDVNWSLDPTERLSFWTVTFGYGFQYILVLTLVSPSIYQRYSALPDQKAINKVSVIHILGVILTKVTSCTLGYILYALYAKCDPLASGQVTNYDQILPYFLQEISRGKSFVQGIFITGYASAAFSTLTSFINTLSIAIYADFLEGRVNPRKKFVTAKRCIQVVALLVTLASLFVSFFLTYMKSNVIELTTVSVFFPAVYVSILMAGIFIPMVNTKSVFWGASIGLIYALVNEIGRHSYHRSPPTKIMRTDECPYNFTTPTNSTSSSPSDTFYFFKISPFYQFAMYSTIVTCVMVTVSWISGPTHYSRLDAKLISPLVRSFLPKTEAASVLLSPVQGDSKLMNDEGAGESK